MTGKRHYGLDWLRIAAFALLIVYHIAMVFAPWDWVIKSPVTYPALVAPMAALTPWRLPLLFTVSGYASRHLFGKDGGVGAFLKSRSLRLLVPLAFGILVIVPPELWVRARLAGYPGGLAHYWLGDYWAGVNGFGFPDWEHLWFVAYLWTYTAALALALVLGGEGGIGRLQALVERMAPGWRLVWVPLLVLIGPKLAMLFVVPEQEGLLHDWTAHAEYFPLFVFGFALGGSDALFPAIARVWRAAALIALVAGAVVVDIELHYQAHHVPPHLVMAIDRSARLAMAWGMIVTLLHVAETWWNRDARWRATLGEAVFPFYIIHHPAIVLIAWAILPLGLPAALAFATLLAGTASACVAFYLVGREMRWLRPLIGLRAATIRKAAAGP